jgi:hypothetical protein
MRRSKAKNCEDDFDEYQQQLNFSEQAQITSLENRNRLLALHLAMMIDSGQITEAMAILENKCGEDTFSEAEKDVKLLMFSLKGILKSNFGKTRQEREEGL